VISKNNAFTRRDLLKASAALLAPLGVPTGALAKSFSKTVIKKSIPSSGEKLAVIGIGSSRTLEGYQTPDVKRELTAVFQAFFDHGGQLIDSSPMYGPAETAIGELLQDVTNKESMFAATKVWTDGQQAGIEQMSASFQKMRVEVMDLMQIHNLRDWQVHLKTLRDWKDEAKIRYLGITTSHGRYHEELLKIMETEPLDFVQFSYNILNREAENRLLPLAADKGIATLINRPFARGELFSRVSGTTVPAWAADFGCQSWGQFFLKFAASHPASTCVIPATSKHKHMLDNMAANYGRLPDAQERAKMIELLAA